MTWPPEFINEIALRIATAEREARQAAEQEHDSEKKSALLEDADALKEAYRLLHGVGTSAR